MIFRWLRKIRRAERSSAEEARDAAVFAAREKEADYSFDVVIEDLQQRKKI